MVLIILSLCVIALFCLCLCLFFIKKTINDLSDSVSELEHEMTKYEAHTNGAFKGAYFMMNELQEKFNSHMHKYTFQDGVLYIQEPIYDSANESVTEDSDSDSDV